MVRVPRDGRRIGFERIPNNADDMLGAHGSGADALVAHVAYDLGGIYQP